MSSANPFQPRLADLAARYLNQQAGAHGIGLARQDPTGEVVPFEAGPVQPIDPRPAWEEARAVLPFMAKKNQAVDWQPPPFWGQLVSSQEPAVALAFCVGNYPQLMRDWHLLLDEGNLYKLLPAGGDPISLPALKEWALPIVDKKKFPDALLALGCLRLARHHDAARDLVKTLDTKVPSAWQAAWSNETAALAWQRGQHAEALEAWKQQERLVPVLFNRGMAALFLGKKKEAEDALLQANAKLSEKSSWFHLGQLYLTFARF